MYNFHMKIKNLTAKYNTHKGGAHASAKDYDRQQLKQELKQMTCLLYTSDAADE